MNIPEDLKPMLAFQKLPNLDLLRYPVAASPKIDGIRCLIVDGVALSRTLKPIRNKFVQSILGRPELDGLDGELIVGEPTDPDVYSKTNSGVMSIEGEPDFRYLVFDRWDRGADPWNGLIADSPYILSREWSERVADHEFIRCHNMEEVLEYERRCLDLGYEGIILRDPSAPYKFGRSTLKEQALLKVKRFEDTEAVIVDVVEAFYNDNEATTNELGRTQRSSAMAGRTRGKGMIGRLVCRCPDGYTESTFEIGSFKGLTNEDKTKLWNERESLSGRIVKFKHFAHGAKDRPRHPVFLGFRDKDDV